VNRQTVGEAAPIIFQTWRIITVVSGLNITLLSKTTVERYFLFKTFSPFTDGLDNNLCHEEVERNGRKFNTELQLESRRGRIGTKLVYPSAKVRLHEILQIGYLFFHEI
jgi:hypothetical protein